MQPSRQRRPGRILLILVLAGVLLPLGCDTGAPELPESNVIVTDGSTRPLRQRDDPFVFDPRLYTTPAKKAGSDDDQDPAAVEPLRTDGRSNAPQSTSQSNRPL